LVKYPASPYINHFIQPDTIIPNPADPQSWNRYSYGLNNPVRYTDPTGHSPIDGPCGYQGQDCSSPLPPPPPPWLSSGGDDGVPNSDELNDELSASDDLQYNPTKPNLPKKTEPFLEFKFWINSYDWLNLLEKSALYMDNYGISAYRHAKGVIPAGFSIEFGLGVLTTAISDLNNPNFTIGQKAFRAGLVGLEYGMIDIVATRGAIFVAGTAGVGSSVTGPGAAIVAGATFFATSVVLSEAGDVIADTFNQSVVNQFFPGSFP
jgi:hypothetical protein